MPIKREDHADVKRQIKSVIYASGNFGIVVSDMGEKIKGNFLSDPHQMIGQQLVFSGKWDNHPKYGRSFHFNSYTEPPMEEGAFVFHFLSNMVKGIGEKTAKDIIAHFGENTADVIENSPEKLLLISGIKHQKLEMIVKSWQEQKHLRILSQKYSSAGITNSIIQKIYDTWGNDAVRILEKNPYKLTDIPGIGFKKADEVARLIGVDVDSPERITACIEYCFEKYMADSGHSAILKDDVFKYFVNEAGVNTEDLVYDPERETFELATELLCAQKKLVLYADGSMSTSKYDKMERYIHERLSYAGESFGDILDHELETGIREDSIALGEKQLMALRLANKNPKCFVVAGYAGSGKTTCSKYILKLYEQKFGHDAIACCALSGVAANRIKNQSGYFAQTIHSLLGANGTGFEHNEANPISKKVILLDEAAMVGVDIFYALLKAIDFNNTTLILLGDPAQLAPVGAGNVFADVIKHNVVPTVTLDKIYRQDEKKGVAVIANQIRAGITPSIGNSGFDDFHFLDQSIEDYWKKRNTLKPREFEALKLQNQELIGRTIALAAKKIAPKINSITSTAEKIAFFQILSPMKDGILGVNRLNKSVQNSINPLTGDMSYINIKGTEFREGDKVIHLSNKTMKVLREGRYNEYQRSHNNELFGEQKVFNGQIGIIKSVDADHESFFVEYPSDKYHAYYSKKEIEAGVIDLAYAVTVHKAQGSEFVNVVIPVSLSHYVMLSPQLMYTAITRAKDKLFLVGDSNALHMACKKRESMERKTVIGVIESAKGTTDFFSAPKKGEQMRFEMKSLPRK